MGGSCCGGVCGKCHAGMAIVIGLILVINQLYVEWDIWVVVGVLIILKGIMKIVKPTCGHCEEAPAKKGKK